MVPIGGLTGLARPVPDALGPAIEALHTSLQSAIKELPGNLFMIRSSLSGEDGTGSAGAGMYDSIAMVERADVPTAVTQYLHSLAGDGTDRLEGAVIVQEMVLGDVSGVCLTANPLPKPMNSLLIEAVPGGNAPLTDGAAIPVRYYVDRDTKEVVTEDSGHWQGLLPRTDLHKMWTEFLAIEATFDAPQDIEWTLKQGLLWILQSRPIVASHPAPADRTQHRIRRAVAPGRDISSIYRAYRIPPNLRMHLLRVAAVGGFICDAWRGPTVDRDAIVLALLLHDIGNIVKADYERFPVLFPEDLRDLPYWKAVQQLTRERYGDSDQAVTLAMANELGINGRTLQVLKGKTFVRNVETEQGSDWSVKIAAYSESVLDPVGSCHWSIGCSRRSADTRA